jgi:hypothetical protein
MSASAQRTNAIEPEYCAASPSRGSPERASTKVFGLPELLRLILPQVPLQDLAKLRRVARLWRDIVFDINHIGPLTIGHGDTNCRCLGNDACVYMPHYTSRVAIRGNPVFRYTHIYQGNWTSANTMRHYRGFRLKPWHDEDDYLDLIAKADHFITDPPITSVAISNDSLHIQAILRAPKGTRVCHILDVFGKIYGTDCGVRTISAEPTAWYGSLTDIISGTIGGTNDEKADHDDGDGVGAKMNVLSLAK